MSNFFSVIIPLYNKAAYIQRAIDSVLSQSHQSFEIVVVDDCSTDDGLEIVEAYHDDHIRIIRHAANQGISTTRNTGIESASYDLISFLDADDYWKPDYLATVSWLIDKYPSCNMFATSYEIHTQNGIVSYPKINNIPRGWSGVLEDYFALAAVAHPFQTSAVSVRKDAMQKTGGFPDELSLSGQDIYIWVVLALNNKIAFLNSPKTIYSIGISQQSTTSKVRSGHILVRKYQEFIKAGSVPQAQIASLKHYIARVGIVSARNSILLNHDGAQARYVLKLFRPKLFHQWVQWLWHYLWSFSPKFFGDLVKRKESIKRALD